MIDYRVARAALLSACVLLASAAMAGVEPQARSTRDLGFFVGRWEGESTFLPAFTPGAKPRRETIRTECAYVLAGAYIQCDLRLTNAAGRERGVMILWNYNEVSGEFEGLSLASNYGQESTFTLRHDAAEKAYVALLPATTADGRAATERLVYRAAADGGSITGSELIRLDDAPPDAWIKTYEFVWRRVGKVSSSRGQSQPITPS